MTSSDLLERATEGLTVITGRDVAVGAAKGAVMGLGVGVLAVVAALAIPKGGAGFSSFPWKDVRQTKSWCPGKDSPIRFALYPSAGQASRPFLGSMYDK